MADFNGTYLTCTSLTEAVATPRTLKAIIEDKLAVVLPGDLPVSIVVQNDSAGEMKLSHLSGVTHFIKLASGVTRQLVTVSRSPRLSEVYLKVAVDNDPVNIEVVWE